MIKMCRRFTCRRQLGGGWDDVSTSDCDTGGFEHPNYDENGEW